MKIWLRFPSPRSWFCALGISLILLSAFADPLSSQGRRSRRGSSSESDPTLPAQREPLPVSELNLRDVPFRIVFETLRETNGRSNWEIFIVDADGSNMRNLTNTPDIDEHYPHASPDGTKVLFVAHEGESRRDRTRAAYTMNLDGTGRTKVADNAYQPTWGADGRTIAFMKGEYERYSSSMTSNEGLALFSVASGSTSEHPEDDLRMLYNLTWSPDGDWFVATSRGGRRGNVLFEAEDSGLQSLDIQGCRPDISPDGSQIAWGRTDQELRIGSFRPGSSGDNVTQEKAVVRCNRDQKVYHVDWSPDGKYLAFSYGPSRGSQAVGGRAAGWNICVLDIEAGKWVQITTDGNHNKEPDWVAVR